MGDILNVIKNRQLTYEQKVFKLALEAENTLDVLNLCPEVQEYMDKEIITDLFKGMPLIVRDIFYRIMKNS